jgi:opacity protein-like surface antigen
MALKQTFPRAVALAGAAALACAAHAADGQPANYVGVQGGINNLGGSWNANVTLGPGVTLAGAAASKRGMHFGVFGGRQTERARFELEYQHGTFDLTGLSLGPVSQSISASGHYDAFTVNAYRFEPVWNQRMNIYGGIGVGWGRVALPQMGFTTPPCNCFPGASKGGLTWLARVGAEYNMGEQDKLFLQYTFLALPRPGSHSTPGVEYGHRNVGSVAVGFRHAF